MGPDRSEKVESASEARLVTIERELGDFSYIVSHDLAAVFRHLAQFSMLLVQGLDQQLSDDQKVFADQIRSETFKGTAMMEQLLVYSRIQQKALDLRSIDITRCADMAVSQLSGEIHRMQAKIVVEPLGMANADPELLVVLFRHLLANALKFYRPSTAPVIHIEPVQRGQQWAAMITDNGIGVPVNNQEKLFRMFARLDPDAEGVGAGLAICRRIARRHGGEVRFLERSEGACVEISIQNMADAQHQGDAAA